MDHEFDFGTESPIVYVRPIAAIDAPEDIQEQLGDLTSLYAIFDADGEHLAYVKDRAMAFAVARTNEFAPVSVH